MQQQIAGQASRIWFGTISEIWPPARKQSGRKSRAGCDL